MGEFRTILHTASAEFVEKRSRFIGTIQPVTTEQEAVSFLAEMKSEYWDAKHNVYAYSLRNGQIKRCSDDGEPKGTAGVPVLDILLKEHLVDCAVVVTRYFGGVLLGTGGLVRAYSHGAKIAVDAAGIVTMKSCAVCVMTCDYSQYGMAETLLKNHEFSVKDTTFTERVTITFNVPKDLLSSIQSEVTDIFCGSVVLKSIGEEYCAF